MGTQLSYGGSSSAPWDAAAADAAAIDDGSADSVGTEASPAAPSAKPNAPEDAALESLVGHIIQALDAHERRPIPGAPSRHTPTSARPSRFTPGGSSVRSGTGKFVSTPRSNRSATQSIARGAAAVSAGSALARRDAAALRDLGLNLDELVTLSAREQNQRILDELLGAPGHPDDEALRRAALATLKEVAKNPELTQDEQIDHLLGSYVYEQALVELTSSKHRNFSKEALRTLDKSLKPYIFRRARHRAAAGNRYLSPALFIEKATSLSAVVLKAIRSHEAGSSNG
ncbi:hypothetical protein [Occultella kanbiaonis]|uniref:hypothetical protein n=1 Tax=Occultella kanbiaonis TaxID=2675754 RepID=UPI0012B75715|nr:hypothetical protein [Occultella kanbiaonis]